LHGGTIEAENKTGQGTSIIITLPAPGLITNTPLVLIVKDHMDLGIYIQKLLWDYYRTELAPNGKEGLELARKNIPDLIISDIMMPEMDGKEMCEQIRSDPKLEYIPVILLSAKSDLDSKLEGFDIGADVYMEKPFLPQHLRSRVNNLIASREQNIRNSKYNMNQLSLELGISRVHLYRKFKELAGMPPKDYMKETRLNAAAKLRPGGRQGVCCEIFEVLIDPLRIFNLQQLLR